LPASQPPVAHPGAADEAVVRLLELIPALGIVEEEREVREQIEVVAEAEAAHFDRRVVSRSLPFERAAVARRIAAVSVVEATEAIDEAFVDRAERNLIGGVPHRAIAHAGD